MKKLALIIGLCTLSAIVLVGYNKYTFKRNRFRTVNVEYDMISISELEDNGSLLPDTKTAINIIKDERGIFYFANRKRLIVLVSTGLDQNKKIEVKSLTTHNNGQTYRLEINEGINTAQGNSQDEPYILIRLKDDDGTKEIYCVNQSNERYDNISYYLNPPRTRQ